MEPPATEFKPWSVKAYAANNANRVRCVAQIKGVRQAVSLQVTTVCWLRVWMSLEGICKFFKIFCLSAIAKGNTV